MILKTTSEVISLSKELESKSAGLYEALAQEYPDKAEMFQSFAKENRKNITNVERAYYGVITDAIEGCFAFNLEADKYSINPRVDKNIKLTDILVQIQVMEETITRFYTDAAQQGKSLMADVPRMFEIIARKRQSRMTLLR